MSLESIRFLEVVLLGLVGEGGKGVFGSTLPFYLFRGDKPLLDEYVAGLCVLEVEGGVFVLDGAVPFFELDTRMFLLFLGNHEELLLPLQLQTLTRVLQGELPHRPLPVPMFLHTELGGQVFVGRDAGGFGL
jgi:hypothetical protein